MVIYVNSFRILHKNTLIQTQFRRIATTFLINSGKQHKIADKSMVRQMTSSSESVLVNQKGTTGIITLNRPKALNAINTDMVK